MSLPTQSRFFQAPLLSLLALVAIAGCGKKPEAAAPPPPEVSVLTLKPQDVPLSTELPGRTRAYRVAEVRPQVSGVLLKRLFTEGGEVKAGQPLYQIDPAPYQAQLGSAEAALQRAEASGVTARVLAERYEKLVSANAVSKQEYDNAVAGRAQALADIASAKAALETARINLTYTKVLAPIAGRIGRSSVTEGALVTAQQTTALATIQQLDPIYVDVTQPSTVLLKLRRELAAGTLKKLGDEQAEVQLTLEDGVPYEHAGKLQFAEAEVDPSTGSVTLRAVFPNPDGLLLPGLFVRERVPEASNPQGLLVPQRAVTRLPNGKPATLVVNAEGKVEQRELVTDRGVGTDWLVSDGLKAGDRVIIEGGQKTPPGTPVRAVEAGSAPPAEATQAAPAAQPAK